MSRKATEKKASASDRKRTLDALERAAVRAARSAGNVLMKHHRSRGYSVEEKPGAGVVTDADLEAEETALKILRRARPDFGFLAEEGGTHGTRRGSEANEGRWIIDPLDGTTNFVHGFPMFCVSIAAEWRGELCVGVIYHPVLKDLYTAVKGRGAFLNGRRIQVSQTRKKEKALLTTGFTYRKNEWLHKEMEAFERLSRVARAIRRPGSAALDLAYTARGVFDGFWERRLSPWDVAAGAVLVQEAGGKVTDFKGKPFQIDGSEILATNRNLHSTMLKYVI